MLSLRRTSLTFAGVLIVGILAAAVVLLTQGHQTATASDAALATPTRIVRRGNSEWVSYGPSAPVPKGVRRAAPRVSAHTAALRENAAFRVLRTAQPPEVAADPLLAQIARHQPDVDVQRVRALDSSRRFWLLPTSDGQICIGEKTTGVQTFVGTCGPVTTVVTTGLSMTTGDQLLALVPDGVTSVTTADGKTIAVHDNVIAAPDPGSVTFSLGGVRHRLVG